MGLVDLLPLHFRAEQESVLPLVAAPETGDAAAGKGVLPQVPIVLEPDDAGLGGGVGHEEILSVRRTRAMTR